ncbi:protocatechuate 4,5-dioxygenase alpha subunit [Rhodopseudomonas thermotolerans]|uniref:Protocatechuate 4,5-dioxygenase alpha subunit n=2 Tax=Rhodopseudomonas TaxID=1073 RepID=A0A336JVM1_9BRAD|nr:MULTISPECIES: protocatechuate 4,5-dioxygenase subunit alpha [Rhodopseudomonas]RED32022.1 protocatechuate 4,5-dioxygenase alpha subunit [Rhodopseudomonas pentothenatexigens]REF93403.1 protocatechuate 4,5-dioxygenase alpha subunit [Rhodopseudomonas thermotolerans]SSW91694.1 protocatechuate 4,5-dioxygenase alpha subunit [Rhodopseudomonas pentothenatexigens]
MSEALAAGAGRAKREIFGTPIFGPEAAQKGYALNKMCFSFNDAGARAEFVEDEAAYCARYGLTAAQTEAILERDLLKLLDEGGNAYYLAKFAGILGLNMQDIGALQTGMTVEQFKAKLLAARDN